MTDAVYVTNFTTLDDPSAGSSGGTQALGINDNGEIVGSYIDANGAENGFVYNTGSYQTLDEPNMISTTALGVNSSGEIVGAAVGFDGDDLGYGFVYENGVFSNVSFSIYGGAFTGINNSGVIVGYFGQNHSTPPQGLIIADDEFVILSQYTEIDGINNLGQVIGENSVNDSYFLYQNSQYTALNLPLANPFIPSFLALTGINDSGEIVGTYLDANANLDSFLDKNGVVSLIVDPLAARGNTFVTGINNSGQIVGYYHDASGDTHGFVADVDALPVIAGTAAGQAMVDTQTQTLFSAVTITDANTPAPTDVVTVTMSAPANGAFSNLAGGVYDPATGVYAVSGSAATVTAALDGLAFTPTIAPGVAETTTFTIAVDDGLVPTATDSTTTVTVSSNLGGGQTVAFSGAPGDAASLHDTGGDWDVVNGDGHAGNVYFTDAQASVFGGSIVNYFDGNSDDAASLYETANNWDTVYGGNGAITLTSAQASVFGGNDFVYFNNGILNAVSLYGTLDDWDTVTGDFGSVTLTNAQASVFGGSDAVYFNGLSGNAVSLYQTAGQWDTVRGADGALTLNGAQASVIGENDRVYFSDGAYSAVSLYATDDDWDTVYGAGGDVTLNDAQTSIFGGGDHVYFSPGQPSAVSLYQTRGDDDFVSGANGAVTLNDAQAFVSGTGNDIYLNGSTNLVAFQPAFGVETVNGFGFNDALQFSKADFADFAALHPVQSGDDTVIALDAADAVTLAGVTASSLTAAQFRFV